MAKAHADNSPRTNDELCEAVEKLNQLIEVLIRAIDELHDDVQLRNNELRGTRDDMLSPFVLRSMPADPTTDDWQLNRVPPEEVDAIRNAVAHPAEHAAPPSTALDAQAGQLENPDLRHDLLDKVQNAQMEACVTPQNLAEFFAVVTTPRRVTSPFQPHEAVDAIDALLTMSGLTVLPFPTDLPVRWMNLVRQHPVAGAEVYDAQLAAIMEAYGIGRIYTYDASHFNRFPGVDVQTS